MDLLIEGGGHVRGATSVPPDKSISHRAAIVAALAEGKSRIESFSSGDDCTSTLTCLEGLGVAISRVDGALVIDGRGRETFTAPQRALFAGNSGTTMRLLAGAVAPYDMEVTITGDESLSSRPMARVARPLSLMGAGIELGPEGRPPMTIRGGGLRGIEYSPPVASAQVKSAVLLAGLGAEGATRVTELAHTRDHTERMLDVAGIRVTREGLSVALEPGVPGPLEVSIPGDFSSAAFLIAAALLLPGSGVTVEGVGLNPTRTGFVSLLERMGAQVEFVSEDAGWEPVGTVTAEYGQLSPISVDRRDVALAIDEVPLVALLATKAEGTTSITGAGELRAKESDRLSATVRVLSAMGARLEEGEDYLSIEGPVKLSGARVSSGGDHRIAMMAALAGLAAEGRTTVEGWEWTDVSFPGFANTLASLGASLG